MSWISWGRSNPLSPPSPVSGAVCCNWKKIYHLMESMTINYEHKTRLIIVYTMSYSGMFAILDLRPALATINVS